MVLTHIFFLYSLQFWYFLQVCPTFQLFNSIACLPRGTRWERNYKSSSTTMSCLVNQELLVGSRNEEDQTNGNRWKGHWSQWLKRKHFFCLEWKVACLGSTKHYFKANFSIFSWFQIYNLSDYEARLFASNLIKTLFQLLNLLSKLFNYNAD